MLRGKLLRIFSLSPPKRGLSYRDLPRDFSRRQEHRVADGGKNSTFGQGSLGYKNIGPLFPIEVNERASCAVLVAGCFTSWHRCPTPRSREISARSIRTNFLWEARRIKSGKPTLDVHRHAITSAITRPSLSL